MSVIAGMSREIPTLKRYRFAEKNLLILKMVVSRTGYTGEDGVEIILGATVARYAISMLLKEKGDQAGIVKPIGLAARDTLRLEAGMPLYGHEIDETVDPLSAGLAFAVKLDKGDDDERAGRFIGQDALQRIAKEGPTRTLVGLALEGRRSPRQGMAVLVDGKPVGAVTSGCLAPTLGHPIAMAYVPAGVGQASLEIDFGSERIPARVTPLPFYKRAE
jgi:aminomethyltransferase